MSKSIRIMVALTCSLLVVLAIFFFSDQSGGESHAKSGKVAEKLAKIIEASSGNYYSEKELHRLEKALDYPVRKVAHFLIYYCLGFVTYISILFVQKWKRNHRYVLFSLLLVLIVAIADETHQLFIAGRGASVSDVMIDCFGGLLGVYSYYIFTDFFRRVINLFKKKETTDDENSANGNEEGSFQRRRY